MKDEKEGKERKEEGFELVACLPLPTVSVCMSVCLQYHHYPSPQLLNSTPKISLWCSKWAKALVLLAVSLSVDPQSRGNKKKSVASCSIGLISLILSIDAVLACCTIKLAGES